MRNFGIAQRRGATERKNKAIYIYQAWTLAVLPHSLVGHSMTYGVPKIMKRIRHLK
jgi:hypothetical protein